ncbi:MAG: hypothetical protein IPH08_08320 [Rhodocyclaceae bacterium]|nr:hypothetical protein [Rhodocyclaceae bacterium]
MTQARPLNRGRMRPAEGQRGAVSIIMAMLIILMITAAVTSVMTVSTTSTVDSVAQDDQTAALFLAETGVERAQAYISDAAAKSNYDNTKCTGLASDTPNSFDVGTRGGKFTYTAAVSTPATCTGATCTRCTVTAAGEIGTAKRTVSAEIVTDSENGVTGRTNAGDCEANPTPEATLNMKVTTADSFVFTHLLYNPTSNWGGDAAVANCANKYPGTSLTSCISSWGITGNYYNNSASIGVYANVATAGSYSITQALCVGGTWDPVNKVCDPNTSESDTRRNYSLVGVIFGPSGGSLSCPDGTSKPICYYGGFARVPDYGETLSAGDLNCPGSEPTNSAGAGRTQAFIVCNGQDYQNAYLPSGGTNNINNTKTCTATDGTYNWSRVASADTLIAGFGGKPYVADTTGAPTCYVNNNAPASNTIVSQMKVNGQPIFRQVELINTNQPARQYSQIWFSHNTAYDATLATANGTINGTVRGCLGNTTSCGTAKINASTLTSADNGKFYVISANSTGSPSTSFTSIGAASNTLGLVFSKAAQRSAATVRWSRFRQQRQSTSIRQIPV